MKNCLNCTSYATRPLLQCFLQSDWGKNTAGTRKEPSMIYKINLRTLGRANTSCCALKQL